MTSLVLTADAALASPSRWFVEGSIKQVVFLANDYAGFTALTAALPPSLRPKTAGARLNQIARDIADGIRDLDEHAVPTGDMPLWWLASNLGDRGPYATRLLPHAAKALLVLEALRSGEPTIFVVDDRSFARTLVRTAERNGLGLRIGNESKVGGALRNLGSGLRTMVHAARRAVSEFCIHAARLRALRRFRASHGLPVAALRDAGTLVCTWTTSTTFPPGKPLEHERYLGRIPAILNQGGGATAYLALPIGWVEPYEEILESTRDAAETVVFVEDFLSWPDVVRNCLMPVTVRRETGGRWHLAGQDLSPVLELEVGRETATWASADAARYGAIGHGLTDLGCRPQAVVCPYENQPWEKVLRHSLKTATPTTTWVAYFHPPHRDMYLSFLPSQRDVEQGMTPDLLIVTGAASAEFFHKGGVPAEIIRIGGAVRYEKLMADMAEGTAAADTPATADTLSVVCATTIELDASTELAMKTISAMSTLGPSRLTVNFHPTADESFQAAVRRNVEAAGRGDTEVVFSTAPVAQLTRDAHALVYNNSASCIEALAAGCPAIFVHRDTDIDYDCLPDGLSQRCRTPGEIAAVLSRVQANDNANLISGNTYERLSHVLGAVDPDVFLNAVDPATARQPDPEHAAGTPA